MTIAAMSDLVERLVLGLRGALCDDASGVAECGVYPGVGDVLAVVQALRVDAQQDFDAVPGPRGDPWGGDPGRQPE